MAVGLFIEDYKGVHSRQTRKMGGEDTMLSFRSLGYVHVVANPPLQEVVSRPEVGTASPKDTGFGGGFQGLKYRTFVRIVSTRRMTVRRLALSPNEGTEQVDLYSTTIRVPFRVEGFNFTRCLKGRNMGVVSCFQTNRVGSVLITPIKGQSSEYVSSPVQVNPRGVAVHIRRFQLRP